VFSGCRSFVNLDDNQYIYANPFVRSGLTIESIRWAFTTCEAGNWHPLAWLSHLQDVTLFFMLVLLAYTSYVRNRGSGRYLRVVLALALGLMAKPMLVTVPFLLLLLDWWPLGRWRPAPGVPPSRHPGQLLGEKAPLLLMCIASSVVTILAQHSSGAVQNLRDLPPAARLGNALLSYAAYLGQTVWPRGLAVYYPLGSGELPALKVAGAFVILGAFSVAAFALRRRGPYLALEWCWFLGMLVPVIGLIHVGSQARADRYPYLPLIGPFLMAACLVGERRRTLPGRVWPPIASVAAILACTGLSVAQAGYWRDSRTLFGRAVAVTRDKPLAHYNLGLALDLQGRPAEALGHYREALRLRPEFAEAHVGLGIVLTKNRRFADAERHFQEASRLPPGSFDARANLGNVLAAQGRYEEARLSYREALRLRPESAAARRLLTALPPGPAEP